MPVVAQSDVEALLGRDLTVGEQGRVDRLLDMAQGYLEDALPGFSCATGTETVQVWPRGDRDIGPDGTVWTPRYPVSNVASITVFGLTIPYVPAAGLYGYRFTQNGQIVFAPWQDWVPVINAPFLSNGYVPYNITYAFGLDPFPNDLAAAVAAPVATIIRQQATNPDDLTRESLGAYSVTYKNRGDLDPMEIGPLMSQAVTLAARKWRRTRQVSVPLARHL